MKKSNWLKGIGLAIVGTVIVFLSQWFSELPSQATSKSENYLSTEKISELKNLDSLGLAYLQDPSTSLLASSSLMDSIGQAEEAVSVMPEDMPVRFPLGTNSPIRMGRLGNEEDENGRIVTRTRFEAVGFINNDGEATNFTPMLLDKMFAIEKANDGQIVSNPDAEHLLIADASGSFSQARRIPRLDLILRDRRRNEVRRINRVSANSICRDGLNAVLNRQLRRL
jgi:hypothetical protein